MDKEVLKKVKENFLNKEKNLAEYACKSSQAIRLKEDTDNIDMRPAFYRDIDRIIHSLSYTRYLNKTQVFSFNNNDHISKRIIHVQLVSKIARTIGRALNLNEDLIEAIALGHDIGHTPIGHVGEKFLDEISRRELNQAFNHNVQSVRTFLTLENNQQGINLAIQTLDGVLCHNGELLSSKYEPRIKTKEEFLAEYKDCYYNDETVKKLRPMTLEGCVVRISDIVGYLGRDIEDAINIGVFNRNKIPREIKEVLGSTNKEIVNTIIHDIIENSIDKPYIKMSDNVFNAITALKKFNYKNIYDKANSKEQLDFYQKGMNLIYDKLLKDVLEKNKESDIYRTYLNHANLEYITQEDPKRIVIDYIAGMTDEYFIHCINKILNIKINC